MDVRDAVLKRRSIRKFNDKEISDEIIEQLLISAMAAPSACNKRPWEFYIIKNKEKLEMLRKVSRYCDYISPLIIIVAGNKKRSVTNRENDFWIHDCAASIENMLLSATELGVSSCWCGLSPMITPVIRVKKILELPEEIVPLALIHFGYSDEEIVERSQYNKKRIHIVE